MYEDKISSLFKDYVNILGSDLDEWAFKQLALHDYPELRLDILAWSKEDL